MTDLEQNLNYILTEKEQKILPNNIREGIKVFDVVGTMKEYVEFEKLQYINFGTNNCLDTQYPLWKSKNWAIEYKISFSSLYNYNHLFSVSENDTKNEIWVNDLGQLHIRLTNDSTYANTASVFEFNTDYTIKHKCIEDTITTYINDQVVNTYYCNLGSHPALNLRFGRRTSGGQFIGKLYYLKLYDNNVLVKDFIPAVDKTDGNAMMYETISKQFHKSIGNSEFTIGHISTEVDTSDATATANHILLNKTAYVNGKKIIGTLINEGIPRNVFIQEEEPASKNGIWIKQSEKNIQYVRAFNKIPEITEGYTWETDAGLSTIPYAFNLGYRTPIIGDYIYLFGSDADLTGGPNADRTAACRYNYKTDTFEILASSPQTTERAAIAAVGTNIFIVGGGPDNASANKTIYRYDTLTNTYDLIYTLSYAYTLNEVVPYGTDLYIFSTYASNGNGYSYKLNTLTNAVMGINSVPFNMKYGNGAVVKDKIYLWGGWANTNALFMYDPVKNSYTQLRNLPFAHGGCGGSFVIDDYIYMFNGTNFVVYDTVSNEYIHQQTLAEALPSAMALLPATDKIQVLCFGTTTDINKIGRLTIDLEQFEQDTLVICTDGDLKTQLYNDAYLEGILKTLFKNVALYLNNTYNFNLESYYGNGTEWVPITEKFIE